MAQALADHLGRDSSLERRRLTQSIRRRSAMTLSLRLFGDTKEKAGYWTRRRAFAQVRRGQNIQLLPFSLVTANLPVSTVQLGLARSDWAALVVSPV
jgi:hypothetical protein